MNRDDIIKLAREAGLLPLLDEDCFQAMGSKNFDVTKKVLERFVTLVLAQRLPISDELQIAEALRRYGLTLVKTAEGYDVLNLEQITAHNIK